MGKTMHVGATLLLLWAATAGADERHDDAPPTAELERLSLEELMHVRVRSPTMVSQSVETVPSVISVVTADQIRALGLRTLADALQLLPGVTVLLTPSGGQRVAVRGKANANDILVTLDGERLNDFYDGSYLTELPLENVERIELIRGPGSALYGTNAFAGVVSIYSKKSDEIFGGVGGELSFDHAVGGGGRAHLKLARTWRHTTVSLFGSYFDSSGPRVLVTRDNADPSYSHVPGVTNGAARVAMAQLAIKRTGLVTARDSLELWTLFLYRLRAPYFGTNNVFAPDGRLERASVHGRLDYRAPLPAGVTVEHSISVDRRDASNLIEDEPPGYYHEVDGNFLREPGELFPEGRLRRFAFTTYRLSESGQLEWKLPRRRAIAGNQLIVGGLVEYAWMPRFDYGQNFCCGASYLYAGPSLQNYEQLPLTQAHKDRILGAAFVHDELQLRSWLWLTGGLRFDWFSDFGTTWNPRAAVVVRPHRTVSFKLLYGRAFRAPSFRDLYDETGVSETAGGLIIAGNPHLRPEVTDTAETSVETSPSRLLTLRANAFYIHTTDVIDVDATFTVGGARVINFPGLQIWGGEAEAQLHFDERNYLAANLSYFQSSELGQGLPGWQTNAERRFIDTRLADLPRLRINAVAVAAPLQRLRVPAPLQRLQLGLNYHYVAALANDNRFTFEALSVFRQPSYHELGINLTLPLFRGHLELNATLALAFGRTIAVPLMNGWYDLPTSAANLFVGVRAHE
jgi:outer membrane receptor protein involved in Fe transport